MPGRKTDVSDAQWLQRLHSRNAASRPSSGNQRASIGFRFSSFSMHGGSPCFLSTRTPSTTIHISNLSLLYGLLRASFRPKGQIAELRSYVRQRERLLEYAASHIQHMQKALTEMNFQLHHVVADITGATGLRIIRAILAAERDPEARWQPCAITVATPVPRRSQRRAHRELPRRATVCARAGARPLHRLPREGIPPATCGSKPC